MAKLGQFEFPEVSLQESVDLARKIYDDLGGEVRRDGLAIILGMSPAGGAFGAKISALRMWRLATGRGMIRLTDQGIQISRATQTPRANEIMRDLATSIPIFNELHERIGDVSEDRSVLAVILQEITGAEMPEVMRRVATIDRIFGGIRGLISQNAAIENPDIGNDVDPQQASKHSAPGESDALPNGWIEFRYDDGALRMRETVENLDVLIGTLESRRNRLTEDY